MKKTILLFLTLVFLIACSSDANKKNKNDSVNNDSGKNVAVKPPARDSTQIDLLKSSFTCARSKTVKNLNKQVKLFGSSMNIQMNNASFSATTDIKIKDGYWYAQKMDNDGARIILDMKSVSAVQVGKDQQLEMGNPDYLQTDKFPVALLELSDFQAIADTSAGSKTNYAFNAKLILKDTSANVEMKNVKADEYVPGKTYPSSLSFDFSIDGMKWGLNRKDAEVTKDDLTFHVVIAAQ
ncbi:MAG: YceI family protein [Bacteroidetes bacterium]|nr:YceI family protein [Bacteroidota bacterium]